MSFKSMSAFIGVQFSYLKYFIDKHGGSDVLGEISVDDLFDHVVRPAVNDDSSSYCEFLTRKGESKHVGEAMVRVLYPPAMSLVALVKCLELALAPASDFTETCATVVSTRPDQDPYVWIDAFSMSERQLAERSEAFDASLDGYFAQPGQSRCSVLVLDAWDDESVHLRPRVQFEVRAWSPVRAVTAVKCVWQSLFGRRCALLQLSPLAGAAPPDASVGVARKRPSVTAAFLSAGGTRRLSQDHAAQWQRWREALQVANEAGDAAGTHSAIDDAPLAQTLRQLVEATLLLCERELHLADSDRAATLLQRAQLALDECPTLQAHATALLVEAQSRRLLCLAQQSSGHAAYEAHVEVLGRPQLRVLFRDASLHAVYASAAGAKCAAAFAAAATASDSLVAESRRRLEREQRRFAALRARLALHTPTDAAATRTEPPQMPPPDEGDNGDGERISEATGSDDAAQLPRRRRSSARAALETFHGAVERLSHTLPLPHLPHLPHLPPLHLQPLPHRRRSRSRSGDSADLVDLARDLLALPPPAPPALPSPAADGDGSAAVARAARAVCTAKLRHASHLFDAAMFRFLRGALQPPSDAPPAETTPLPTLALPLLGAARPTLALLRDSHADRAAVKDALQELAALSDAVGAEDAASLPAAVQAESCLCAAAVWRRFCAEEQHEATLLRRALLLAADCAVDAAPLQKALRKKRRNVAKYAQRLDAAARHAQRLLERRLPLATQLYPALCRAVMALRTWVATRPLLRCDALTSCAPQHFDARATRSAVDGDAAGVPINEAPLWREALRLQHRQIAALQRVARESARLLPAVATPATRRLHDALRQCAAALVARRLPTVAAPTLRAAFAALRDDAAPETSALLAATPTALALCLHGLRGGLRGGAAEAERTRRGVLALLPGLLGRFGPTHMLTLRAQETLATALRRLGRDASALALLEDVATQLRAAAAARSVDERLAETQRDTARVALALADALATLGLFHDAQRLLQQRMWRLLRLLSDSAPATPPTWPRDAFEVALYATEATAAGCWAEDWRALQLRYEAQLARNAGLWARHCLCDCLESQRADCAAAAAPLEATGLRVCSHMRHHSRGDAALYAASMGDAAAVDAVCVAVAERLVADGGAAPAEPPHDEAPRRRSWSAALLGGAHEVSVAPQGRASRLSERVHAEAAQLRTALSPLPWLLTPLLRLLAHRLERLPLYDTFVDAHESDSPAADVAVDAAEVAEEALQVALWLADYHLRLRGPLLAAFAAQQRSAATGPALSGGVATAHALEALLLSPSAATRVPHVAAELSATHELGDAALLTRLLARCFCWDRPRALSAAPLRPALHATLQPALDWCREVAADVARDGGATVDGWGVWDLWEPWLVSLLEKTRRRYLPLLPHLAGGLRESLVGPDGPDGVWAKGTRLVRWYATLLAPESDGVDSDVDYASEVSDDDGDAKTTLRSGPRHTAAHFFYDDVQGHLLVLRLQCALAEVYAVRAETHTLAESHLRQVLAHMRVLRLGPDVAGNAETGGEPRVCCDAHDLTLRATLALANCIASQRDGDAAATKALLIDHHRACLARFGSDAVQTAAATHSLVQWLRRVGDDAALTDLIAARLVE